MKKAFLYGSTLGIFVGFGLTVIVMSYGFLVTHDVIIDYRYFMYLTFSLTSLMQFICLRKSNINW